DGQEVAKHLSQIEIRKEATQEALGKTDQKEVVEPQATPTEALKDVRKDLDKMIAEAEKQQNDPLKAAQKALETVDKLLKEQVDLKEKVQEAMETENTQRLPNMAAKQDNLAKRTDDLAQQPMPTKDSTKAALDKASKAMENAAKAMENKKGADTMAKQDQAIEALKEAQKDLQDKVAEIQKREADMAALADAAKKLDE